MFLRLRGLIRHRWSTFRIVFGQGFHTIFTIIAPRWFFFLFQFYLQSSSGLLKTQESKHDVQSNPSARRGEKKAAQIEADSLSDSDVVCKFIRVLLFLVLA